MGVVYSAEDVTLQRTVALKFLSPHALEDAEAKERFLREARAAAGIDHPNVCTVYEIGEQDGQAFLAMAFIEGQTVKEKLARRPLKLDEALDIGAQCAEGLRAAHHKGIVHRDIKSANLMVTADGSVKVMDFGLAQLAGQSGLTKSRTTLGTASYMSPEQAQSQPVDCRGDIWSLGVVVYEMLTGRLPFEGEHEAAVLYAIIHSSPEPITSLRVGIPAGLDRVVAKAMAKDPGKRYQHVSDLLVDLRALRKGLPVTAPALSSRRRIVLAAAGGLGAVALATAIGLNRGRSRPIGSLAVLPLENLTGDTEQEYFVDGMTDALITDLSKVRALKVISRKTAMLYKGSKKSLKDIARELNVEAVVGGSVAREAGRVRVTAQLTDASTEANLWADSYERELTSVLALQAEVARTVAGKIQVKLRPEEEALLASSRKVNPATYEAYLRGMFWLNRGTYADVKKGLALLEQAVQNDPGDPLGYAAMALGFLTVGHLGDPIDISKQRARSAAEKAMALDNNVAEAHLALGILQGYTDWKWDRALQSFDRAVEINPNLVFAHFHKAWLHLHFGRYGAAFEEAKLTQALEPLAPDYMWICDVYRLMGREQEALVESRKAIELHPKHPIGHIVLAQVYSNQGKHDQAISEFKTAAAVGPTFKWYLACGYLRAGRPEETKSMLAELKRMEVTPWTAFWRATLNAGLGNKDEAFRWIDFEPHHDWIASIGFLEEFRTLRADPRFAAKLKQMNVPAVLPANRVA